MNYIFDFKLRSMNSDLKMHTLKYSYLNPYQKLILNAVFWLMPCGGTDYIILVFSFQQDFSFS